MPSFEQSLHQTPRIERQDLDKPLLLYKVGMLGSVPLDFMSKLADLYDMSYVSSDIIRQTLVEAREVQGMKPDRARNLSGSAVRNVVERQTREYLGANEDLALDSFSNTPKSRGIILDIAQRSGGLAIGLAFDTPLKLALDRVEAWSEADEFVIPTNEWSIPPMTAAKEISRHLQLPTAEEQGLFFMLDGSVGTKQLLEQTQAYFHASGLMQRFEDI